MKAITAVNTVSIAVDATTSDATTSGVTTSDATTLDATIPDTTIADAKEQKIDRKKYYKNRNERKRFFHLHKKAKEIYCMTRDIKRFLWYTFEAALENLQEEDKYFFLEQNTVVQLCYRFCVLAVIKKKMLNEGNYKDNLVSMKHMHPYMYHFFSKKKMILPSQVEEPPSLHMVQLYRTWMDGNRVCFDFSKCLAAFLAFFLSFTSEFHDKQFRCFKEDRVEEFLEESDD